MAIDGVIPVTALVERVPGVDPRLEVARAEIVAEAVSVAARLDEKAGNQRRRGDADARGIHEVRCCEGRARETDWRVEDPAPREWIIPVSFHEERAAGGPCIVVGNPAPIGLEGDPEAGAPGVSRFGPVPAAGRPDRIGSEWVADRPGLDAGGRGGQVLGVGWVHRHPDAGGPLPASIDLVPVAWYPVMPGRRQPPDPADPDVITAITAILIPAPVAGDPLDVVPLGLLVRGLLFDRLGRFCRHHGPGSGVIDDGLGKRFVHRAARLNLHPVGAGPKVGVLRGDVPRQILSGDHGATRSGDRPTDPHDQHAEFPTVVVAEHGSPLSIWFKRSKRELFLQVPSPLVRRCDKFLDSFLESGLK